MENTQERRFRDVLAQVSKGVKSGSADVMRELGVHLGQNFLLEELWKEDRLTLGELARRMRVEVPTVTRMTKRMETAGLLTRVTDDRDRRMVRIALTDAGMALHDRLAIESPSITGPPYSTTSPGMRCTGSPTSNARR